MKKFLVIVFIGLVIISNGQSRKLSIPLEETSSYCGGASPSEDITQELKRKKPFAHKMVYIYKKGKCVDSSRTDTAGTLKLKLKRGKYNFYLPWKHFKAVPFGVKSDFDEVCLKKEWQVPDATLEVKAVGQEFINRRLTHQFCQWQYNCVKERHIPPGASKQD